MFSTLSTYTRALNLKEGKVLLSDTVGFISKLPAYMIEAFKSTLDELRYADLILLVIDISEPIDEIVKKYQSCIDILNELQINPNKIIHVLNKVDLIDNEELVNKTQVLKLEDYIAISAKKKINIDKLLAKIEERIFKPKEDVKQNHLDLVLVDAIDHDSYT
jgi:GTP-binding protein HflX